MPDLSKLNNILLIANPDGSVDAYARQGKTWEFSIIFFQDEKMTQPVNLTGYAARGQIKKAYGDQQAVESFVCTIPVPDDGEVKAFLSAENTAKITCGKAYTDAASRYVFDVEVYKPADPAIVDHGIAGKLFVFAEVTT